MGLQDELYVHCVCARGEIKFAHLLVMAFLLLCICKVRTSTTIQRYEESLRMNHWYLTIINDETFLNSPLILNTNSNSIIVNLTLIHQKNLYQRRPFLVHGSAGGSVHELAGALRLGAAGRATNTTQNDSTSG